MARRVKESQGTSIFSLKAEADIYVAEGDNALTAQQWQAIQLLVLGRRGVDVAQEIGVTPETVSRWKSSPVYMAALNAATRDCYAATVGEVRSAAQDAVQVLRDAMAADDMRLRLSAALATLRLHLALDANVSALPVTPADVASERAERAAVDALSFTFFPGQG